MRKFRGVILIAGCLFLMLSHAVFAGTINLPRTGQTKCYTLDGTEIACAGTGQDGEIQAGKAWPNPRFTVNSDCVTDNLTGLMWARNGNLPNNLLMWQGALDYAAQLNSSGGLCGYTDWVLPNFNELESLVNASEPEPAAWLNVQGFYNVQPDIYWTSTTDADIAFFARYVDMWNGYGIVVGKDYSGYVLPVRSGQSGGVVLLPNTGQTISYSTGDDGDLERGAAWPNPRFTDNGTGTVTDNLTGLMWTKDANAPGFSSCEPGISKTWQEALDYAACLNSSSYLGYNDWRLPNKKELYSLIDISRFNPSLQIRHPFTNVQSDIYWTSTTSAYDTNSAWFVDLWYGDVYDGSKYSFFYAWPVRGGIVDNDHDGYTSDVDCNDSNPAVNPGAAEISNNGVDDDCNPATPVITTSGSGNNYPVALFRASLTLNVNASSLGTGTFSYYYTRARLYFVSTSITGISVTGGVATITGAGKVNNVSGYTFTATITNGSPDKMGLQIKKSDGTIYYNAVSKDLSSGNFTVVGQ